MIQVTFKNGGYCCWNFGEKLTCTGEAILLIANGKELDVIKDKFTNIPMCDNLIIMWTNSFAAFTIELR